MAFAKVLFDNQESFSNSHSANQTLDQVIDTFYGLAENSLAGMSRAAFAHAMFNSQSLWMNVNDGFVYATQGRSVGETPVFFINGVRSNNLYSGTTFNEWKTLLDGFFN